MPTAVQKPIASLSEHLSSQTRASNGIKGDDGAQGVGGHRSIQLAANSQAARSNNNIWNWDFQGTKPKVVLSIDHTGMGTNYNTPQLLNEMMKGPVRPNITIFPMWRGGGGAMPHDQQKLMDQLLNLQQQYPSVQIGVHPDTIGGTNQLYKFLHGRTNQPIPFSYHGSNASFSAVQQQKVIPPYLENSLRTGQLAARSTMSDKLGGRNSYDYPVIPSHWGQDKMQDALIANAKLNRPSHIFFHSHETRQNPWSVPFQNLMSAIQEGKIQTIPFPKPPNWTGNPMPQQ